MSDFWINFPDKDLSPVDLAEKKWALANEELEYLQTKYAQVLSIQSRVVPNTIEGAKKIDDRIKEATRELEDKKKEVHVLWLRWVKNKSYVSDATKKRLGCYNI
jgi:hypothetical protein